MASIHAASWVTTESLLISLWSQCHKHNDSIAKLDYVKNLVFHADPFVVCIAIVLGLAAFCWLYSVVTGNVSTVDRIWSLTPFIFTGIFARKDLALLIYGSRSDVDWRLIAMFGATLAWGLRLTYNFARKGGYDLSTEDYRWPVIRAMVHPVLFHIFNLTFIALYQNVLLLLITAPAYVCYLARGVTPWNSLDSLALGLWILFLVGETTADQQQWTFQNAKYAKIEKKQPLTGDYAKGFLTRGLFAYSRHPNFFCEMSLWWALYLFSVAATGVWINWSIIGTILLTMLFQGSTQFTEHITSKKYPEYKQYQKTTSRLIPWFPGKDDKKKAN